MRTVRVTLINKLGLHARASAKLVSTAARFQSQFNITKDQKTIDGKSIMGVLMLAAPNGTELVFTMDGPDEEAMEHALVELVQQRFHEQE